MDAMGNSAFLILVFNVPSSQEIIVLGEELPRFRGPAGTPGSPRCLGLLGPPGNGDGYSAFYPVAFVAVFCLSFLQT